MIRGGHRVSPVNQEKVVAEAVGTAGLQAADNVISEVPGEGIGVLRVVVAAAAGRLASSV